MSQYGLSVSDMIVSIFTDIFGCYFFHLIYFLHNRPQHSGNILVDAWFQLTECHQQNPQHACNNPQFYRLICVDYLTMQFDT